MPRRPVPPVSACAVSDMQMIEVAKALARAPRLLLMDEPTAVLSAVECGLLFRRLELFRAAGGSAVFTSHKLDEVRAVADRVAVLRDGRITEERIVRLAMGVDGSQHHDRA